MVSYCCVENCHNNSSEKRKRSKGIITFHAFPSNPEVRSKWLKAIGRPSWEPPNHARVCSAHFTDEHVNREHQRTRLKDDSCPVRYLPANSYFEATEVEVCRICLATDVKMFSLQEEVLKICMKSIVGLNKDIEGLPQFVCFQCSFQLIKCYNLVERSLIAKTTLQNIFAKNGEITKHMVRGVNRAQLNLKSSLTYNIVMPKTTIDLQYDDDLEKYIYAAKSEENMPKREKKISIIPAKSRKNNNKHNKHKKKEKALQKEEEPKFKIEVELDLNDDFKIEDSYIQDTIVSDNFVNVNDDVKDDMSNESIVSDDFQIIMDEDIATIENEIESKIDETKHEVDEFHDCEVVNKKIVKKKKMANKKSNELTPDEVEMQNHFNIVILTLEQQIRDRELMRESTAYRDALYKCVICYKTYLHPDAYKMHMDNHDPSRGEAECPVCRLRYKNDVLARSHANRTHGKKFYCRTCPKVFNNVRIAKKHQKRHEGYEYKCPLCDFSTLHESAYGSHVRTRHAARHVCGTCGHAFASERGRTLHARRAHPAAVTIQDPPAASEALFRCVECDVRFTSEGAWRVHMLTSTQHKRKRDPCDPTPLPDQLKCTCPRCGEQFRTAKLLQQHNSEQHGGKTKKTAWRLPGDHYPAGCEHCGEIVNNRKEHYFHVRKVHPKQRASYQPVITAVCDTCGKGFQNSTKLHLHELRHSGVGTVRCPHCPRLFFDKYQLARHIGVHSDARPYACTLCDKAFKLRSNLDRHAKVHSGATPYECTMCSKRFRYSSSRNLHVRTVHYKLPHPPRSRKKHNNT